MTLEPETSRVSVLGTSRTRAVHQANRQPNGTTGGHATLSERCLHRPPRSLPRRKSLLLPYSLRMILEITAVLSLLPFACRCGAQCVFGPPDSLQPRRKLRFRQPLDGALQQTTFDADHTLRVPQSAEIGHLTPGSAMRFLTQSPTTMESSNEPASASPFRPVLLSRRLLRRRRPWARCL